MNRQENSSGAVGARNARACDSCLRRRARWYCAADDAFLCQLCDSSVHSANPLARRHERVRLKTASSPDFIHDDEPMWHHGCKRKARSPRGTNRSPETKQEGEVSDRKPPRPDPMVPDMETVSIENFAMVEEEQLLYRVPIFDPVLAEFSSPQISEDEVKNPMLSCLQQPTDCAAGFLLPSEIDIGEFEMDMESLLRQGLVEDAFCMEFLGTPDSQEDSGGGTSFHPVKEEDVEDNEGLSATAAQFDGETFNISFNSESEEEEKVAVTEGCGVRKRRRIMLSLDYSAVISAWSTQGCPWTDGTRPQLNPDDCWPEYTWQETVWGTKVEGEEEVQDGAHGIGGGSRGSMYAPIPDGGREARVSRYREKRRTRLFSKKIRYEVRKLNAEKRPRMKGRFVKRSSFATTSGAAASTVGQPQCAF